MYICWDVDVSENSGVFPPNHPFVHRVFHDFHHPFWGTLIFGNTHIYIYIHSLLTNRFCPWKNVRNLTPPRGKAGLLENHQFCVDFKCPFTPHLLRWKAFERSKKTDRYKLLYLEDLRVFIIVDFIRRIYIYTVYIYIYIPFLFFLPRYVTYCRKSRGGVKGSRALFGDDGTLP